MAGMGGNPPVSLSPGSPPVRWRTHGCPHPDMERKARSAGAGAAG